MTKARQNAVNVGKSDRREMSLRRYSNGFKFRLVNILSFISWFSISISGSERITLKVTEKDTGDACRINVDFYACGEGEKRYK